MKQSFHITKYIAFAVLLIILSVNVPTVMGQSNPVLRVDKDGRVFLDDKLITARVGNSPPIAFENLQGYPAKTDSMADRGTWHSYSKVGILVFVKAGKKNDFFSIVLPSNTSPDFPNTVFAGTLVMGNVRFPFEKGRILQRNQVLKLLEGISDVKVIKRENNFSIYLGSTSVDIEFDSLNELRNIAIGIKADDAVR